MIQISSGIGYIFRKSAKLRPVVMVDALERQPALHVRLRDRNEYRLSWHRLSVLSRYVRDT